MILNTDLIRGQWKEIKGAFKQKWAKLSEDDLRSYEGDFDQLSGKLQKLYGYSKERASSEIDSALEKFQKSNLGRKVAGGAERAIDGAKARVDALSERVRKDEPKN